jgi:DNA-binding response OmpR family regulator
MGRKILVIDDDPMACQAIAELLKKEGYQTVASFNFEDALQKALQILPDLVMIDAVMPEISGFDACRKIKETFHPHPPRVVMMTAKLNAFDPVLAREMGADDFVVKTGDMVFVIQAAQKILSKGSPS